MATWDRGGNYAYRVTFDGSPYEAVTHRAMVRTVPHFDDVYNSYRKDGLKIRDESLNFSADMIQCKLNVNALTIELAEGYLNNSCWSQLFDLDPTATTWLKSSCTAADTSIEVEDTSSFPNSGFFWLDSETIYYSSKDGTHFLGCIRGVYSPDSDAATYHYVIDPSLPTARVPEVTNWPVLWIGRRVNVYRYNDQFATPVAGENPLVGDGTLVFRGLITQAPSFDGIVWRIGVDHISTLLDTSFGQDLSNPSTPTGVHYPPDYPFRMQVQTRVYSVGAITERGVTVSGIFADNDAWALELTSQIAAQAGAIFGTGGSLVAESLGPTGWQLKYHTASTGDALECFVRILSNSTPSPSYPANPNLLDCPLGCTQGRGHPTLPGPEVLAEGSWGYPNRPMDGMDGPYGAVFGYPLSNETDYWFGRPSQVDPGGGDGIVYPEDGAGYSGRGGVPRGAWTYTIDSVPFDDRSVYFSGAAPLSPAITRAFVKISPIDGTTVPGAPPPPENGVQMDVEEVFPAVRRVVFGFAMGFPPSIAFGWNVYRPGYLPEFRFGMRLTDGSLGSIADVLDFITANQQQYSPLGIMPPLRTEDFDSAAWHAEFDHAPPINNQRYFSTFQALTLFDLIKGELQANGCFLILGSVGKLIPKKIALLPLTAAAFGRSIDQSNYLTDKMLVAHETSGLGQVNTVTYETKYDPMQDAFNGDTYTARDVSAFGQSSQGIVLSIEQKSVYLGDIAAPPNPVTLDDVLGIAIPWFGTFAKNYFIDTLDAFTGIDGFNLGDTVTYTVHYLINNDGTNDANGFPAGVKGKEFRQGLVIGLKTGTYSPRTNLTLLATKQLIAGYAPSWPIGEVVDLGGGNLEFDINFQFVSASGIDNFSVGDKCEIIERDSVSPTIYDATVVAITSTDITVNTTWPGTGNYYISISDADTVLPDQTKFCQVADEVGYIDAGGPNFSRSQVFGA